MVGMGFGGENDEGLKWGIGLGLGSMECVGCNGMNLFCWVWARVWSF